MQIMAGAKVGGIETFFFDAVCALDDACIEQFVVARPHATAGLNAVKARGIGYATAEFVSWWPWPTRRVLRKAVADFQPDIIQYWTGRAASFAPETQARQIGWYGGYRQRKRYRSCTHFIGITPDLMRHLRDEGVADDQSSLVHIFAEARRVEPASRAALSTPEGAPLLLALSRLHWKKGLDVLLEATARVPGAYLWIAGEGPDRAKLEEKSRTLGIDERVRFLGWRNDREALLAAADICVFPSRFEPFGAVMIEAWAAGRPLIAAASQGPAAYVESGANGILVPVDDVTALVAAIRAVVDDKALRTRLVAGGFATFEKRFTRQVYMDSMSALYTRLRGDGPQV
jgi:glycosyltransferase involved in cell wall biosynthesis